MPKKYTPNCSLQVSRQIRRNRKKNLPRLNKLKECIGCMKCGKCNIPGKYLDGHHVDENHKFRPISVLVGRRWPRLIREIFGIDRDKSGGGGPIEFVCQRYHEERHQLGEDAKTCVELENEGFLEPWRIHSRNPRRKNPYN